ncbi:MAG TPA: protein kinase [Candidatus Polarisedimenticolaceae bacterium]|nr:protein kinase [Candidatus Polarisedimenticolaceae bacterium]
MSGEDARLLEVARAISDGVAVNWDEASAGRTGSEQRELHELRRVEQIVQAHRAQHPARLAAVRRWGSLEILRTIGRGAFGEVLLARDPRLDRQVALKLLHVEAGADAAVADAVIEEGRLLARLRHPNVVTVYGAEVHDGQVGLWMERIEGQPLSDLLHEGGTLGPREAGLIGLDLCRALAAVHAAGLVHRDVKAQNVMRERGGRIVLMDFSAGTDLRSSAPVGSAISGTPLYMPPEAFEGSPPDHRGDIHGLGVLLFHLVTGTFPHVASTVDELREAHRRGTPQALAALRPELPPAFVRVVEKAMSRDPAARFESAASMEQALAAALGVESQPAPAPRSWRPGTIVPVLAVAALLSLAIGARFLRRPAAPPPSPAAASPAQPGQTAGAPPLAPAAPARSPLPDAYTVEATFLRGSTVPEPLSQGERIHVGDVVSLHMKASRPLWVYVVNEDEQGVSALLFPLSGGDLVNPLPPGETRLPGTLDGETKYWQVTSAGGREHFLVVASPERLAELERETAGLTRPTEKGAPAYALLDTQAKDRLRGITGLVTGPAPLTATPNRHLFELAKKLETSADNARGPWIRRLDLDNPR